MTSSKARGLIRFLFGITEDKHLNTQQIRQHKLIIHNERVANPKNENMLFFLKLFPLQARYVTMRFLSLRERNPMASHSSETTSAVL